VKALRVAALLLITLSGVAGAGAVLAGCGSASRATSPAEARLEHEDLVTVSRGLRQAESSVGRETIAAKLAWPLVANGLPASIAQATRSRVAVASETARAILVPPPMSEAQTRELTGPAAGIAGLYRTFSKLAELGWTLIGTAIDEVDSGTPAAARFARENVALYIDSVYDGHFDAALIGKSLRAGYRKLSEEKKGFEGFGATLTQAEVDALARFYSPATERLHPHPGVKLGS
jgi:hypothetical protein